jgi:hypothetical protein
MTGDPVLLEPPVVHWACPDCSVATSKPRNTDPSKTDQEYHNCEGQGGLMIPLVEVHEPGVAADARHIPQLGPNGVLASVGTEHGPNSVYPGRVDRTIFLGPARPGQGG